MPQRFTRRQFFGALGSMAVAAGVLGISLRHSHRPLRMKPWRDFAMEVLAGTSLSKQLVIAHLSTLPEDVPLNERIGLHNLPDVPGVTWNSEGCVYRFGSDLKAAVAAVRKSVEGDLARGRVVLAGGWVISETEASVAAMCAVPASQLTEGTR